MHYHRAFEQAGDLLAAFCVAFEQFHSDPSPFQLFRDSDAELLAAEHEYALEFVLGANPHEAEYLVKVLPARHDVNMVIRLDHFAAMRDNRLGSPKNQGD